MQNITKPRVPHNTLTTFTIDKTPGSTTFEIVGLFYLTHNAVQAAEAYEYLMGSLRLGEQQISLVLEALGRIGLRRIVKN